MNNWLIEQIFNRSGSRRLEYIKVDRDLNIVDTFPRVGRFADRPDKVIYKEYVRLGFPELIGVEEILIDIFEREQERFELKVLHGDLSLNLLYTSIFMRSLQMIVQEKTDYLFYLKM